MWTLEHQERLSSWFAFRKQISLLTLKDAVYQTNRLWNTAHISNQYYCQTLPEQWPDPWQLILDNYYDNIGKALGMLYTLQMSEHTCEIELLCGVSDAEEFNLVSINDGLYTLNWDLDVQVNTPIIKNKNIVVKYSAQQLINRG